MANMINQYSKDKREGKPLPERDPNEHYATPEPAARIMSEMLFKYWWATRNIAPDLLDVGADEGVWGEAFYAVTEEAFPEHHTAIQFRSEIHGIELRETERYHWRNDPIYASWTIADATDLSLYPEMNNDIVFGNPPFIMDKPPKFAGGRKMNAWLAAMKQRYEVMAFLLRTDFVGGKAHYEDLFADGFAVMAQSVHRIHFVGHGDNQTREFAFFIWDQKHQGMPVLTWFDHKKQTIDPRFLERYK